MSIRYKFDPPKSVLDFFVAIAPRYDSNHILSIKTAIEAMRNEMT